LRDFKFRAGYSSFTMYVYRYDSYDGSSIIDLSWVTEATVYIYPHALSLF